MQEVPRAIGIGYGVVGYNGSRGYAVGGYIAYH